MSNVGLFLHYGDGIALAYETKEEGAPTFVFIKDKQYKDSYNGMVDKVKSLGEMVSKTGKSGTIVFDSVGEGAIGDGFRKAGYSVVGGMKFADDIELKRMVGIKFMKDNGIKIPPTFEFRTKAEGIAFIKKNPNRYVYKPDGNLSTAKTYVGKDAEDLISFMQKQSDNNPYILQLFIKGIELSTEVWFSLGDPIIGSANCTIETKKAMAGDLCCATGCMSSCVWPLSDFNSKAVKEGIGKIFEALKKAKFTGCIDLNSILSPEGLFGIEWTARMGFSAIYALLELLDMPLNELFYKVARGQLPKMELKREYGMTMRIGILPAPMEIDKTNESWLSPAFHATAGQRITMKSKEVSYYLLDAMLKDGELVTSGADGWIMEIGSHGKSIEEVEKKMYEAAHDVTPDSRFYRIDAFERAKEEIPKLRGLGYETL